VVRWLWVLGGSLFIGLGILGIFLPLLPTTPFLLLAAACYFRGSQRFYSWLITHPRLGPYIRNYREKHGITKFLKIFTLGLLWLTILISIIFVTSSPWVRILLFLIALGVTIHILLLKTLQN